MVSKRVEASIASRGIRGRGRASENEKKKCCFKANADEVSSSATVNMVFV